MKKKRIVLALETTQGAGSISILENLEEKGFWVGLGEISKAAEFLVEIEKLFIQTNLKREETDLIAVSDGYGSFTGGRIGWALARGLKKALGCEVTGISLFEALSQSVENSSVFFICLSKGRREVCLQKFERVSDRMVLKKRNPKILDLLDFKKFLENNLEQSFFLESVLFDKFILENREGLDNLPELKRIPENFAKYIGLRGQMIGASDNNKPSYFQD